MDFLVSEDATEDVIDKDTLKCLKDILKLPDDVKSKLCSVIDALVRDYKAKQAYAS